MPQIVESKPSFLTFYAVMILYEILKVVRFKIYLISCVTAAKEESENKYSEKERIAHT